MVRRDIPDFSYLKGPEFANWKPPTRAECRAEEEEFLENLKNAPRRTLVKIGWMHMLKPCKEKICDRETMRKKKYSVAIFELVADSIGSGVDDEQGFMATVYFEPKDEALIMKHLEKEGAYVEGGTKEPVDPDTTCDYEQQIMLEMQEQVLVNDVFRYELVEEGCKPKHRANGPWFGWEGMNEQERLRQHAYLNTMVMFS
eukprot:gnl/MRDRNA2_/MRDRNA2_97876_c0_seq1.p1 gnl/MRDRNA2_/MRDRNA2_97876_c0~~gnl/MRDRNA2_/MRDRNA2_97876_c0_seq1.p1  ORF type:complete len:200 (+),score=52.66 gnl/MRDRNA2_/MRDRNA2_97876_c0_seq1:85-684(+)